jgi:hypothetical protein
MTAESSKYIIVIVLGRKILTVVTLLLHEVVGSRLVYLHYVPLELSHSAKSHPSVKSQNSASAKCEEYCRPITVWIIRENPDGENLSLEGNRMPDDRALDRVQRTKALRLEQDTSSRKIDPHRKQIIQTHSSKKTTIKATHFEKIFPTCWITGVFLRRHISREAHNYQLKLTPNRMSFPYKTQLSLYLLPDLHFQVDYTHHIKIYTFNLLISLTDIIINLLYMYSSPFTKNYDML